MFRKSLNPLGKKELHETVIRNWYHMDIFESAVRWAKQYHNIAGVNEAISEIQRRSEEYKREMGNFLNQVQPEADRKFSAWESVEKKKNICKQLSIGAFIILFLYMFIGGRIHFSNVVLDLLLAFFFIAALIIALIGGGAAVILKVISISFEKKYTSYIYEAECESRQINTKYERNVGILRDEIDRLYLDSLEPAHRETILMRRDQERQHQERMRIEQEKLNSQRAAEEEQRKMRQAQEELLYIEREREERIRRNRY